ncbi:nicotinate-nucleotide adenylyltransferase [Cyanobium sp. NIES-981]|uniref:nicotinate-nucleotide adenylyltransferase n=1 Tax=Cyanobium sp. NIES-981 TaxID=1851505 RepID=UPI0007DE324E|nr:nicotinate-nucleotide adenylyltransferase [Cyanobium sp. NIES-981]SBO44528.1 Nicotinic acid mononucleotide adenylyltransferase [Cyanobium sp. NIES-981]
MTAPPAEASLEPNSSRGVIALFGTSADPPTLGHQALLRGLLDHFPRVATWASDNPLKQHGAPLAERAALLGALVRGLADPRLEQHQELSSPWAITTLDRAAQTWPGRELVFVVGSDLAPQIPRWKEGQAVLRRCRLAIVPREGWPVDSAELEPLRALGAQLQVLPLAIPPTASSALRLQPDPRQIPASVWPVLLEHNLYGLADPS